MSVQSDEEKRSAGVDVAWACRVLERARLEVMPTSSADEIAAQSPPDAVLTVTSSAKLGPERTMEVALDLRRRGYYVVPHLAARAIRDESQLAQFVDRMADAGIQEAFVIGGDNVEPAGAFSSAAELLEVLVRLPNRPSVIGIGAYPEGHTLIPTERLWEALLTKMKHASYAIFQLSFNPEAILGWLREARQKGFELPVYLCLPGTIRLDRLMRIGLRLGLGASLRYLEKQRALLPKLLTGGVRYDPWSLLKELASSDDPERDRIIGVHWSTFNSISDTVSWLESQRKRLQCGQS